MLTFSFAINYFCYHLPLRIGKFNKTVLHYLGALVDNEIGRFFSYYSSLKFQNIILRQIPKIDRNKRLMLFLLPPIFQNILLNTSIFDEARLWLCIFVGDF